jgi:uncharacterized membrane protein
MSDQKVIVTEYKLRRRLLLWSVALNIFLICGVAAFVASSSWQKPAFTGKGGPAVQFETLASRLPSEDAGLLRTEFAKKADAIADAHTAVHRAQDHMRMALRAEPYDAGAAKEAMSAAEAEHLRLTKLLQDVIASAAGRMSPEGRSKLSDWQPGPPRRR